MSILFDEPHGIVHLTNGRISYVMQLLDGRYLLHRYFGPVLRRWRGTGVSPPPREVIPQNTAIPISISTPCPGNFLRQAGATTVAPLLR